MQNRKLRYRKTLWGLFALSSILLVGVWLWGMWMQVPSNIRLKAGNSQELSFSIPATGEISCETITQDVYAVDMAKPVTFITDQVEDYQLSVKLFGIIPFKQSQVSVIEDIKLKPVGKPIGIYVKTDGILVLESGEFKGEDGQMKAPATSLLQGGDYILKFNGEDISDKKLFMQKIGESDGQPIVLTIERNQEIFNIKVSPEKNEQGEYKLGIWIRDNAQGVGTMTYVDENHHFGALGHGINDVDTATLMKLENGSLYHTDIVSVKKGQKGTPGELTGLIAYSDSNRIGEIIDNTKSGIFGTVDNSFTEEEGEYLEVGLKQEVTLGAAQILSCVDNQTQYYDVEIIGIHPENDNVNRGIEIKVTDERLLEKTGGIVQGMSGSPIIQNGKLIGAVTHVLVNDPARGYGIFIENMLEH